VITQAIAHNIKSACGQHVNETSITVDGFHFKLTSGFGDVTFQWQFPGLAAWLPRPIEEHWPITLKQCEALGDALAKVESTNIRLAYEASIV
jgi:hypothetical protein